MAAPARAASVKDSLTISPISQDIHLAPEQVFNGVLKVTNSGQSELAVKLYAEDFFVNNDSYEQEFGQELTPIGAGSWFSIEKEYISLKPTESRDVSYRIRVPISAVTGGHYGVIFVQTVPLNKVADTITPVARAASLFYIEVPGSIDKNASLAAIKWPFWQKYAPVELPVEVTNNGNSHFRQDGQLVVRDVFGNIKFTGQFRGYVLPKTSRTFAVKWENPPAAGLYKLSGSATLFDKKVTIPTHWMLYLPGMWVIGLAALVLAGLGLLAWWCFARWRHRHQKSSKN